MGGAASRHYFCCSHFFMCNQKYCIIPEASTARHGYLSFISLFPLSADVLFENCFIVSRFLDYYELSMLIIVIIVVMCNV